MTDELLPPDEKIRAQAQTLFLCGYAPKTIAQRLNLKAAQVETWVRLGRWDQSRDKVRRAMDKKILATVKRNASQLVNDQLGQLRWMQAKLFNNLRGLDIQGNAILDPDTQEPIGERHVLNAVDAMQLLAQVNRLTKDWLMQIMPSISESLPTLDPAELHLIRTDERGAPTPEEERPPANFDRARRRAAGKKRSPAADKILSKVLPFNKE